MTTRELKHTINLDDYLSIEEAATLLEIKEGAIRNYLSLGKFVGYKLKSLTLLKLEELKQWKASKGKRSAKSVKQ